MARTVVEAFVSAKFADHAASRALYAVAAEAGAASVVARLTQRSQQALSNMLATASDTTYGNLADISFVLSTAAVGPVQGLLASNATPKSVRAIQQQLTSHDVRVSQRGRHAQAFSKQANLRAAPRKRRLQLSASLRSACPCP